ncbi:MAG: biotin transporter BioY [Pseudomonadota bacterium]
MTTASRMPTLAGVLTGASESESAFRQAARIVLLVIAGSILLTISAQIKVPFWPVPMTMQPLAVLLLGAAYGARLGGATVLAYLAQGAAGLPVFAAGGGLAYFTGPTGGYLIGFFVAAVIVGFLAERGWDRTNFKTALSMVLGLVALYACGVAHLSTIIGLPAALEKGMAVFLVGDLLKIALAALILPTAWKLIGRKG